MNHPFWVYGLSYIPLELFLAIKAFKSKKFVLYSVLLGKKAPREWKVKANRILYATERPYLKI